MKMTMKELAKKYYWTTLAELWDELSEKYPPEMTEEEFAEVFAKARIFMVRWLSASPAECTRF